MSTTCSDILTRALALSVLNDGILDPNVSADAQTALVRIDQAQQRAFTAFNQRNRTENLVTATVTSTAGSSARTVDLSALASAVGRIVRVTLSTSGTEVALVDPMFPDAELAPRYTTKGSTMVEVSNDWDTAASGTVNLSLTYLSRPASLAVTLGSSLTQAVTVPDRFTDLLVFDLGAFLAESDAGREDSEVAYWMQRSDAVLDAWVQSAAQFGGVQAYTFDVPTPSPKSKA